MTYQPEAVIIFSTADWDAPYWTNKQHTAMTLADRGIKVFYLESPGLRRPRLSKTDFKRIIRRIQSMSAPVSRKSKFLWVCSTIGIPMGHRFAFVRMVNGILTRYFLRRWLSEIGAAERSIVWAFHPYIHDAIHGLNLSTVLYHCVDDLAAIPGIDADAFTDAESQLLKRADVIFTTSPKLHEHCAKQVNRPVYYERNVADLNHFAQARSYQSEPSEFLGIPHPRLGYIGVLSAYKLDIPFIIACAKNRPDHHWIFIGDEPEGYVDRDLAALRSLPNTHFLGHRPYAELPRYLAAMDIATLPVKADGYMSSVFPMKFYEYLAAGKPILSRSLGALDDLSDLIYKADTPEEWAKGVNHILTNQPEPICLDSPALRDHSWEARLDRMLKKIGLHQSD